MSKRFDSFLSYIYPVLIETREGTINPYLEIAKFQGRFMLNTRNVNYSFGGLHTVFEKLFRKVRFEMFDFENILLLGMGGGSVISILRDQYHVKGHITAVEKDETIIELAKKYFDIDKRRGLTIVNADAYDFVSGIQEKYDLIISDVFIDANVPEKFLTRDYLEKLQRISPASCCIVCNTIVKKRKVSNSETNFTTHFKTVFSGSETHRFIVNNCENSLLYYNTKPVEALKFV